MKYPYLIMHSVEDYDYLWRELPLIGVKIGNSGTGSSYMHTYGSDGLRLELIRTRGVELRHARESNPPMNLTRMNSARHFLEYAKGLRAANHMQVSAPATIPPWSR